MQGARARWPTVPCGPRKRCRRRESRCHHHKCRPATPRPSRQVTEPVSRRMFSHPTARDHRPIGIPSALVHIQGGRKVGTMRRAFETFPRSEFGSPHVGRQAVSYFVAEDVAHVRLGDRSNFVSACGYEYAPIAVDWADEFEPDAWPSCEDCLTARSDPEPPSRMWSSSRAPTPSTTTRISWSAVTGRPGSPCVDVATRAMQWNGRVRSGRKHTTNAPNAPRWSMRISGPRPVPKMSVTRFALSRGRLYRASGSTGSGWSRMAGSNIGRLTRPSARRCAAPSSSLGMFNGPYRWAVPDTVMHVTMRSTRRGLPGAR